MPLPAVLPSLIATDLDGTLLRRDGSISNYTRAVLRQARAAGVEVVMVSGRPARHVAKIEGARELGGLAICVNGALIYDLDRELVLHEARLSGLVACELIRDLRNQVPGICFAVEVGLDFGWEPSFALQRKRTEPPALPVSDALLLCARGVNKLIARHPEFSVEELAVRSQSVLADRATGSYSGAPFLEISAFDVSKASALAAYCRDRNIAAGRVLSFGDMPNDLPMLAWAGRSVAMANAHASVLAASDEVTLSNEEDGVAVLVERLLANVGVEPHSSRLRV